ncbi:hypothetical protein PV08_03604 [Exophiala spinifera]|uniref:C2H2-type domain-containing protein n=1 Tax=Exophiala spinifera TaxID=91928 RepID=A0A0D2BL35_9EURO|nr:uncharacterized protein PV08_03604 [Exophiala spinifera]KIW19310.1 hypothetical protein PV08_03604 [Exophiala spinifera]
MSYQPFECHVCHRRFTRNENLKRHAALHSRSKEAPSHRCDYCTTTFSRADLRRRHMKKVHLEGEDSRPTKRLRQDTSTLGHEPEEQGSWPRQQTLSVSPSDRQYDLTRTQSSPYGSLLMDYPSWNPRPQDEQGPVHHGAHQYGEDGTNLASASPISDGGDNSSTDSGSAGISAGSTHINRPVFHAADGERGLQLGSSAPKLSCHTGAQHTSSSPPPPSTVSPSQIHHSFIPHRKSVSPSEDRQGHRKDWFPSPEQIARGVHHYFAHVSNFFPFLHRPTFDAGRAADYLILGMLSLAYQYDEDPDCGGALGSGARLSARCFHHARVLLDSNEEGTTADWSNSLAMIQAYLLLQVCAMMYLCGGDSAHGLRMHSKMIFLARSGGLMQTVPSPAAAGEDLGSLWREFVTAESHKRTLFALHQMDALWYQFLSIPRSLSHLEIKHDLPCPEDCWTAASAEQWAHRRLLAGGHAGEPPPMQYGDAVRRFLSDDHPDVDSIPDFDAYGAVNIAQFMISSVREISGWLTMTGRLSIERLEPLRSSLEALRPLVRLRVDAGRSRGSSAVLCEATWQMAMIELQTWSPAHTGGIVGGSVDALLQESTHLAPPCEFLVETDTARSIRPHVDWFLRQVDDAAPAPGSEPPWVLLYAYKAFLIAWRLVCGASVGAMQVVGVADGDAEAAMAWARKAFGSRRHWQVGRMILTCLDVLAGPPQAVGV